MLNILEHMGRWKKRLCLVLLGLAVVLALPPIYIWPLSFVGISGFFLFLDQSRTKKQAFMCGWWFGMGFFGGGLYWLTNAFLVNAAMHAWLIPIAIPALAVGMGLFIGLVGLVTYLLWRNRFEKSQVLGRVLVFAVVWTLVEWLRGWIFTGFPWNLLATIWGFSDEILQMAAYVGVLGMSLLSVAALTLPSVIFYSEGRRKFGVLAVALSIPALMWLAGFARLSDANVETHDAIVLRLVQPNIAQADKWRRDLQFDNFALLLELSRMPAATDKAPTHILWPETAVTYALNREPKALEAVASVVPKGGAVLTGTPRMTPRGQEPFQVWNSMVAVNDTGEIAATYDKAHLVPFGEYIPFREYIALPKLTAGSVDFSAGPHVSTIALGELPAFSPLICYEVIFSGQVIDEKNRPHWLFNLTNDGWYGDSPGPYQHLISARLRSVEEGMPLVRVANTGVSIITDSFGRVRSSLSYGERGFLDVELPKRLEEQPLSSRIKTPLLGTFLLVFFVIGELVFTFYRKR